MRHPLHGSPTRLLDPMDRLSEVLFGLIMVLTFTSSMSVASAGRDDVRAMLREALGCNLAWGIVDAVMYVLTTFLARARALATLQAVRAARDDAEAHRAIAAALPPLVASVMRAADLEAVRHGLVALPAPPRRASITRRDLRGATEVFLLVVLSTFPVAVPFLLVAHPLLALRLSNAVAVGLLFAGGWSLGRYSGVPPARVGTAMAGVGAVLTAVTIVLGG